MSSRRSFFGLVALAFTAFGCPLPSAAKEQAHVLVISQHGFRTTRSRRPRGAEGNGRKADTRRHLGDPNLHRRKLKATRRCAGSTTADPRSRVGGRGANAGLAESSRTAGHRAMHAPGTRHPCPVREEIGGISNATKRHAKRRSDGDRLKASGHGQTTRPSTQRGVVLQGTRPDDAAADPVDRQP